MLTRPSQKSRMIASNIRFQSEFTSHLITAKNTLLPQKTHSFYKILSSSSQTELPSKATRLKIYRHAIVLFQTLRAPKALSDTMG